MNFSNHSALGSQSVVEVIDLDKEINAPAIEISGLGKISWDLSDRPVILRYLSLHLRNMDKFLSFDLNILGEDAKLRQFKISNRRSHCVISNEKDKIGSRSDGGDSSSAGFESTCELPLAISSGWQMCRIDIQDLCANAFGVKRPNVVALTVHGNCRVSKIFFHNEKYSDAEMPMHLRAIGS